MEDVVYMVATGYRVARSQPSAILVSSEYWSWMVRAYPVSHGGGVSCADLQDGYRLESRVQVIVGVCSVSGAGRQTKPKDAFQRGFPGSCHHHQAPPTPRLNEQR
jgi:hypothetical protein